MVLQLYGEWQPVIDASAQKMKATCREGCAHCCRLPASATLPEAILLAEKLMEATDWSVRRGEMAREITHQLRLLEAVDYAHNHGAFFKLQVPCVFLKDNRCSVYSIRPVVCRTHFAVSPPENCAEGATDPMVARLNMGEAELDIQMAGAKELGEIVGGPIAATLPLAFWRLGEPFPVDADLVRNVIYRFEHACATQGEIRVR